MNLISPHGSENLLPLQVETKLLDSKIKHAQNLPKIKLSTRETNDLIMLGIGGFTPLNGFMNEDDWFSVCSNMHLKNGIFWPIPITLSVTKEQADNLAINDEVALISFDNNLIGILTINSIYYPDKKYEALSIFGTDEKEHPGVNVLFNQPEVNLGGKVEVFNDNGFKDRFGSKALTPREVRDIFIKLKWNKIAAFQTRNPMHRSHEYLVKTVLEIFDGVLIHSLLGNLKPGDIPAKIRVEAIDSLLKNYFVENSVIHAGYPLDMRYAGPREALLHALFRQNYGCTHLIVGRDHAGVGSYYGPFDSQNIFDTLNDNDLLIKPIKIDWTFYCQVCNGMASTKTCPHEFSNRVLISGTEVRRRLKEKENIPATFSRPEVVKILSSWMNSQEKI